MFKMTRNELKCAVHASVVRIPGEGSANWEAAVLQCFDTKAASGVTLQALSARICLGFFVAFVYDTYVSSFTVTFGFFLVVRLD